MGASAYTKERLEEAAREARTLTEALVRLEVDPRSPTRRYVLGRMRRLGVDTSHFRTPTRRGVPRQRRTPETVLVEQPAGRARRVPSDRLKWAMTASGVPERCAMCGTEPRWRGRPLPLEVDHIDGNWRDNRIGNLRLLCPNCHSTTDNYRGRAKRRAGGDAV
ncbi:HNH endonuclease [Streptomyces althioticus]|uniref:HNH endonuclease n=1 Tax=Streptomyces althioticus TaxID=83380 RepID=A0ABZ1Y7U2_9ACTN